MIPKTLAKFQLFFLSRQKWMLVLFSIAILIISFLEVIDSYIVKIFIDKLALKNYDDGFTTRYIIIFVLWWETWNLSYRLFDYTVMKIVPKYMSDISSALVEYIMGHSYKFYQDNFAGSISNRIKELSKSSGKIFTNLTEKIISRFISVIAAIIVLGIVNKTFSILMFIWLLIFGFANYFFLKPVENLSKNFAKHRSDMLGNLVDLINNISSVRLFSRQRYEMDLFNKSIDRVQTSDQKLQKYNMKIDYIKGMINNIMCGFMIYYIVKLYKQDLITMGDLYLVFATIIHVMSTVWMFLHDLKDVIEEVGTCRQALSLIVNKHDIADDKNAKPIIVSNGNIEFSNVYFTYLKDRILFEDLNIKISAGTKVGLVGYSGSGKSSFVNLIARIFDIQSGKITIDGMDISKATQESLRENIAFIPQDPMLFHRNVTDNIKYGKLDATQDQIIEAAKLANAHEFILQTEHGYDSFLGERGIKLSGGQRQRIAIARAILKDAQILILDEATSSLDSITERSIQKSLDMIMSQKGRTTIVIAHRLSTLLKMDRIIVFDKGKIVEDGTHDELYAKNGMYTNLWNSQINGFITDCEDANLV